MAALIRSLAIAVFLMLLRFALARLFERVEGPAGPSTTVTGRTKKDPQCGTYVAEELAVRVTAGGREYFFCSAVCRDAFFARSS